MRNKKEFLLMMKDTRMLQEQIFNLILPAKSLANRMDSERNRHFRSETEKKIEREEWKVEFNTFDSFEGFNNLLFRIGKRQRFNSTYFLINLQGKKKSMHFVKFSKTLRGGSNNFQTVKYSCPFFINFLPLVAPFSTHHLPSNSHPWKIVVFRALVPRTE